MKYIFRNLTIPFVDRNKKHDPWSFAAAGLSSLLGGLFGMEESDSAYAAALATNEANKEIAKMTNESNEKNVRETNEINQQIASAYNANQVQLQNDMNSFNYKMWQENNKYNSPVAQINRGLAAGINPNSILGNSVASSPVQQTSIPAQQMARYESSKSLPWSEKVPYKNLGYMKDMISQLAELPFVKERIDSIRLDNKRKAIENELSSFELREKEDEAKLFNDFSFYRSNSGDLIPVAEYENLTNDEKNRLFGKVKHYRNTISDKTIDIDTYKALPDEHKSIYVPEFDSNILPDVVKLPVHTRDGFETWKSLQSVSNLLENIRADKLQNRLRSLVLSGQLENTETIKALVDLPTKTFDKLVKDIEYVAEQIGSAKKHNKGLSERLKNQDKVLKFMVSKLENESDSDTISIIKKHVPEGGLRDFLITAVAVLREASGNSGIMKYAGLFGK